MKTYGEIYQPKNIALDDLKVMLASQQQLQQLNAQQEQLQSDFKSYFQDFLCFLEVSPLRDRKVCLKGNVNVFDEPVKSFISHLKTLAEGGIETALSSSIASMMEFLLKQMRKDDADFFQALKNEWLEWINGFKTFKPRQEQIQILMDELQSISPSYALQKSLTISFQFALNQIANWAQSLSLLPLLNMCEYLKKLSLEYPPSMQVQLLKRQLQGIVDNKQTIYQQLKGLIQTHVFNISWIGQLDFEQSYLRHLELKQIEGEKNFNLLSSLLRDYLQERETYRDSNGKIKEYFYGYFFSSFQKSYTEKRAAVTCLLKVLNGEQDDLTTHLPTLRNGRLGSQLRAFVKQGLADDILGVEVRTVSELVRCLSQSSLLDKTL